MKALFIRAINMWRLLKNQVKDEKAEVVVISAAIEAQIAELETEEDREVFLKEYGLKESGLNKLLQSFLPPFRPNHLFYSG